MGAAGDQDEADNTALFSSYVLSIYMDGPTSGGDGIVMYNDTRGAVALQHDDNASVINTIRLTRTQWNDVKEAENKTTADQLKSKTKRFTDGFDKFSCSKGALAGNPWICTAW